MAKSNRQRLLQGGPLRPATGESPWVAWSKLVGKRTADQDEMSDSAPTKDRPASSSKSGIFRSNSKKKGSGADHGRNAGPSSEGQRTAGMRDSNISSLPTRLVPHRESVQNLVDALSAINPALSDFMASCSEHASEVNSMEAVLADNVRLEAENTEHLDLINSLNNSLGLAHRRNDGAQKELEEAKAEVEEERAGLHREREFLGQQDLERREEQARELAAMKDWLMQEHEELVAQLKAKSEKENTDRTKKAEEENRKAKKAAEQQQKKLETEVSRAQERVVSMQAELEKLQQDNADLKSQVEDLTNLKKFLNSEKTALKAQVHGFTSPSRPLREYMKEFDQIADRISYLASEYLQDFQVLLQKDLEIIHKELIDHDSLFQTVPISDSKESLRLCRAHIQRVFAKSIFQFIWKPFSCDRLVEDSGLADLLLDVHERVAVGSHKGSRQEIFWTTQTCQALQTIRPSGCAAGAMDGSAALENSNRTRAGRAYATIEPVVRPLIAKDKHEMFRQSTMTILNECVDLWDQAMVDEIWFEADNNLGLSWYNQCRSKEFDPADETEKDAIQAGAQLSHDDVLMLFPRIRAWKPEAEGHKATMHKAPGAFPEDDLGDNLAQERKDTRTIEIVHPGRALAKTSELVRLGSQEVSEQPAVLEQVRVDAVESYRDKRHRRQSSTRSASTLVASVVD